MHAMTEKKNRRGIALGSFVLVCLVMPQIYWLFIGYSEVESWEKALWAFFAGGTFLLSFFFVNRHSYFDPSYGYSGLFISHLGSGSPLSTECCFLRSGFSFL